MSETERLRNIWDTELLPPPLNGGNGGNGEDETKTGEDGTSGRSRPGELMWMLVDRVECESQEDWTGADSVKIQIWLDPTLFQVGDSAQQMFVDQLKLEPFQLPANLRDLTAEPVTYRKKMYTGDVWSLGVEFPLGRGAKIRVVEEDEYDPDDEIKTIDVEPATVHIDAENEGRLRFAGDDAAYLLDFSVSWKPDPRQGTTHADPTVQPDPITHLARRAEERSGFESGGTSGKTVRDHTSRIRVRDHESATIRPTRSVRVRTRKGTG